MNERLHSIGESRLRDCHVIVPHRCILGPRTLVVLTGFIENRGGQQRHYTIGKLCRTSKVNGVGIYWRLTSCVTRPGKRGGVNLEFVDLVYVSSIFIMLLLALLWPDNLHPKRRSLCKQILRH